MRARNRDNARRTRKRKKLYIAFLNNALESLENVLNPKESSSDNNADNLNEKNVNSGSSYLIEASIVDDNNQDSEATSNNKLLDTRLPKMKEFLSLRTSPNIYHEQFEAICSTNITHLMPLPAHRDLSSLAIISDLYTCKGIDAIVDDTRKRASFCDTVRILLFKKKKNIIIVCFIHLPL